MSSAEVKRLSEIIDALPEHIADRLLEIIRLYVSLDEDQQGIFESCVFPFLDLDRDPLEAQRART